MPGLHGLILSKTTKAEDTQAMKRIFEEKLEEMKHYPEYTTKLLFSDTNIMLGFSGYSSYPLEVFESDSYAILIEGSIYNKSLREVRKRLSNVLPKKLSSTDFLASLKRFLLDIDGEFVIVLYNKDTDVCMIFNDALGMLPLYYNLSPNRLLISREVKFIIPFLDKVSLDKIGLAEYLLFRCPLGERTLVKDIYRLPPATLIVADVRNNKSSIKSIISWNLDSKSDLDLDKETDKLVGIFLTSIRNRHNFYSSRKCTPMISLSGGIDSRAVLAALTRIGVNPLAVTLDYSGYEREISIARKVAKTFKIKHQIYPVSQQVNVKDMLRFTHLKDGLLYVALYNAHKAWARARNEIKGATVRWAGTGGGEILAPSILKSDLTSFQELVNFIIDTAPAFNLREASRILGLDKDALIKHFTNHFSSYPEQTLEGKHKHFRRLEKPFKWLFEGIDMNRLWNWSIATPFLSTHFYKTAIKIPRKAKEFGVLRKNWLIKLDPRCAKITYYNIGIPIIFTDFPKWMPKILPHTLYKIFRKLRSLRKIRSTKKKHEESELEKLRWNVLQLLGQQDFLEKYIDVDQTQEIVAEENNVNKLYTLATILLYMQIVERQYPH